MSVFASMWSLGLLGIHAGSETERIRYAELQAKHEFNRLQRELAFEKSYAEAFRRLYPDIPIVDYGEFKKNQVRLELMKSMNWQNPRAGEFIPGDRLIVFIEPDCSDCMKHYRQALAIVQSYNVPLDLFFLHMSNDTIHHWAKDIGLPYALYKSRRILLNNVTDEGGRLLKQLRTETKDQTVRFFRRRGSRYDAIQL